MQIEVFIGIDPGPKSGCAWVISKVDGEVEMDFIRFGQATDVDVVNFLRGYSLPRFKAFAVLEQMGIRPDEGAISSANSGKHFGMLRGALMALKIPFDEIRAQKWQQFYVPKSTGTRSITKADKISLDYDKEALKALSKSNKSHNAKIRAERKKKLKQKAQQLYPHIKVIDVTADAILISDYCLNNYTRADESV